MSRPLTWLIVGGLLALSTAASVDALRGRSTAFERVRRSGSVAPAAPSAFTDTRTWARGVAAAAGYVIVGTTGSAWVVRRPGESRHETLYLWVTRRDRRAASATGRLADDLGSEHFPVAGRVGSVTVFGDGVRFAWRLFRGTAWAEAAGDRTLTVRMLRPLVAASAQAVPTGAERERVPTCTAPQLELAIELLGGTATAALRHVRGASCRLRRLPVELSVRDRSGRLVPLLEGEGLTVSPFRGDFSPGFEQLRNVTFLPRCTPETTPRASYLLSAQAGPYSARRRVSGRAIACFDGG